MENQLYFWSDREERCYATLRRHGTRWIVEWGDREPPGGDSMVQRGKRISSRLNLATQVFLKAIGELSAEADEVVRVQAKLQDALSASE